MGMIMLAFKIYFSVTKGIMQNFWTEVKIKVLELKALDHEFKLVHGSAKHRYEILQPVSLSEIEAYETIHSVRLPDSYRSFLQFFGAGGCGPHSGILKFPEKMWPGDLSKPLQQKFVNRNAPTIGLVSSIENCDGMMEIGVDPVGEHSQFLVVNGSLRGHVVYTDVCDTLYVSRPFDEWYKGWLDCAWIGVGQFEEMKKIKIGDNFDSILKDGNILVNYDEGGCVGVEYIKGSIELDANRLVKCVHLKKNLPLRQMEFSRWPS